jgi:type II secretory pathway pseudopilin PulG
MKKQNGFSLLSILMAIVIIAVAYYFITKSNISTSTINKNAKQVLSEQGIDTYNYQGMINTAQDKVDEINKKIKDQEKKLNQFK